MRISPASTIVIGAFAFALGAPAALGQAPAGGSGAGPVAGSETAVEVSVTDASGAPIFGLRASDFTVLEDGAPVRIGRLAAGPGAPPPKRVVAPADPPPALLALVVGGAKLSEAQAGSVLAGAGGALAALLASPSAQVLVAAGSTSVTVLRGFTRDADAARAALEVALGGPNGQPSAGESLESFVASLGGLPGRKALVWIGGGPPPTVPAPPPANGAPGATAAGSASAAAAPAEGTLAGIANAADVRVYAVDASGGASPALRDVALATGGLASADPGGALAAIATDFLGAYTVSYLAPHGGDGLARRLEIRVRREGATVRARQTGRGTAVEDRIAGRTAAALRYGVTDNPLGIQLAAAFDAKPREGSPVVSVLVTIPLAGLSFAPTKVAHECNLTLWLAARDDSGRTIQAPRAKLPVSVPNDRLLTALTQSVGYTFRVPLAAGPATLAVTVRDEIAMREATAVTSVAPADQPAKGEAR